MKGTIYGVLILFGLFFSADAENLFKNGDFEEVKNGKPVMWVNLR